jgi:tetratricopeptide (TPR) repeat protein
MATLSRGDTPPEVEGLLETARRTAASALDVARRSAQVQDMAGRLLQPATGTEDQRDQATLHAELELLVRDAAALQQMLLRTQREFEELRARREQQERWTRNWWARKSTQLRELLAHDPTAGVDEWLRVFVAGLTVWELDFCAWVANEPLELPAGAAELRELLAGGIQAIQEEAWPDALPMIERLAGSEKALDAASRADLLVFAGRIRLGQDGGGRTPADLFEQARRLAPEDPLPHVALGDLALANSENEARDHFSNAVELAPDRPDGYFGIGRWSEAAKLWDEAEDWYDQGLKALLRDPSVRDPGHYVGRLLSPVSGNLALRLARALKGKDPAAALAAADRALELGVQGEGDAPDRLAHRLRGQILEDLHRPVEAAEAHTQAAKGFQTHGEESVAVDLLTRAKELDPERIGTYWDLAEALRIQSYTPEPPFVDEQSVRTGLKVWHEGAARQLPTAADAWTYTSRALLSSQLAQRPGESVEERGWEAAAYLERALLLRSWDAYPWAYLANLHSLLGNDAVELLASAEAVELDASNTVAQEERAGILADLHYFSEALHWLQERSGSEEPTPWVDAMKAWTLVRMPPEERTDDPLELINKAISKDPSDYWFRETRAEVLRSAGNWAAFQEECRSIYEELRARPEEQWSKANSEWITYGWTAFWAEEVDAAVVIFERLRGDPLLSGAAWMMLGFCRLVRNDRRGASDAFGKALERGRSTSSLVETVYPELPGIERMITHRPDAKAIRAMVHEIRDQVTGRLASLKQAPADAAERELLRAVEAARVGDGGFMAVAARAGLGRLYRQQQRWFEAVAVYEALGGIGDRFPEPEAQLGLTEALRGLARAQAGEGDVAGGMATLQRLAQLDPSGQLQMLLEVAALYERAGEWDPADALYKKAVAVAGDEGPASRAATHASIAIELAARPDSAGVWEHLTRWADAAAGSLTTPDWSRLRSPLQHQVIGQSVRALAADPMVDATLRRTLSQDWLQHCEATYLQRFRPGQAGFGDDRWPIVTPIRLEADDSLFPQGKDTPAVIRMLDSEIPEMREGHIEQVTGVFVPGIRLRGNPYLYDGAFTLMLDDVPLVHDRVLAGAWFCPDADATGLELRDATPILTAAGRPAGRWVHGEDRETVERAGLPLWDPYTYMLRRLEGLLLERLGAFLGVQEVDKALDQWVGGNAERERLRAVALPGDDALVRFTLVQRALVAEGIPVSDRGAVLNAFARADRPGRDVVDVVDVVREALRPALQQRAGHRRRLNVDPALEAAIAGHLVERGGRRLLNMTPAELENARRRARDQFGDQPAGRIAAVVGRADLRHFTSRLVALEAADVPVFTPQELGSEAVPELHHPSTDA